MRNASSPIPFPNGIQIFERDIIYSFRYDGSGLTLSGGKPLLPAPQNVVVTAGNGGVTVTWDAPPRVSSYSVYYGTGATPPETPAQTGITGTAATISGLTNNTPYYVWVASVNAGNSTMSGAKSITLTLPAPQNVVLQAGNGGIAVKWDAVSSASSYNVYYGTDANRPETPAQTGITGPAATISGLTNNATYYVWVESINAGGSTMSGAQSITLTLPAPQNVVLQAGNGGIAVKWDAVSLASSYKVYYGTGATLPETPAQTNITGPAAAISGLTNNTTYYVWVESVNSGGSTLGEAKSLTLTLPAPQNIVLDDGNDSITVKWDAVSLASSYNVYYGTGATLPETPAQTNITGTTAAINGLTNGTTYYVWVESVNAGGSTMSGAKSIILTLPAPLNVVLDDGNGSITVKWDAVSLASSYNVYYSSGQTPPETPAQTNITRTTATISGLTNNATYYVWVESVNSGGSSMSASVSVSLLPVFNVATSQEFTGAIASINASSKAKTYFINLTNNVSSGAVSFTANAAKTIIIKGEGAIRAITNTGTAALFTVPSGITLLLENNLHLNGNAKEYSVVSVDGGNLVMNAGSRISNAKSSGVRINNGTFTMEGGEISGNTTAATASAGGVYVYTNGTFTMKGGMISGNTAPYGGGGVYVYTNGTFTMKGGMISDNTAYSSGGGGVYVTSGTFTMQGGSISGNTTERGGGGVDVNNTSTFTMEGGRISGNIASSSSSYGGGVYVNSGNATFIKRGNSTIDATNSAMGGKAAYVSYRLLNGYVTKVRNTAAGPNVNLDSSKSGSAGGWE
jgi:hypothetical protein